MRTKLSLAAITLAAVSSALISTNASAQTQNPNPKPHKDVVNVKEGDTLSAIADNHQTTYIRLFDANQQISDPDVINPGDNVRIPAPNEQLPDRPLPVAAAPAPAPAAAPVAAVSVPRPAPQPVAANYAAGDGSVWDSLAQCESGGNWAISTGNGFYGGLQFTLSSWAGVGGSGYPNLASREEQIARAQILQSRQGWSAWPACSAKLGL
jgi:LysM repeat protein